MTPAIIDACCLIDLQASGHFEAVLRASGHVWHLAAAVEAEVQFVRQPDPSDRQKFLTVPIDLGSLISASLLTPCQPDDQEELDLFTRYAALFRSDGEAMCLALAESRGWTMATDDRKALRLGQQAGVTGISSPQLLKMWADSDHPSHPTLVQALKDIELHARFRPNSTMPECQWWLDQLSS